MKCGSETLQDLSGGRFGVGVAWNELELQTSEESFESVRLEEEGENRTGLELGRAVIKLGAKGVCGVGPDGAKDLSLSATLGLEPNP